MLLPTPLVSCSVSAPPNPPPPAGRHRALLPTWNLMDTGTPTLSAGGVGAWSWDHTSRQRCCPPGTARSLQGLGFPCWDGRGGFCREKEQRGLCGGDVRRQLCKCGWLRRNCERGTRWNLFSSNPCWVCPNNRFSLRGVCWPLMGWVVFASPQTVAVPWHRFWQLAGG